MVAERPLLYTSVFWAWDQHGFLQSPWPHYSPTIAGEPSANTSFRLVFRTVAPQNVFNDIIENVVCRAVGIHYQCNLLANLAIITSCVPLFPVGIHDGNHSDVGPVIELMPSIIYGSTENVSARRVRRDDGLGVGCFAGECHLRHLLHLQRSL